MNCRQAQVDILSGKSRARRSSFNMGCDDNGDSGHKPHHVSGRETTCGQQFVTANILYQWCTWPPIVYFCFVSVFVSVYLSNMVNIWYQRCTWQYFASNCSLTLRCRPIALNCTRIAFQHQPLSTEKVFLAKLYLDLSDNVRANHNCRNDTWSAHVDRWQSGDQVIQQILSHDSRFVGRWRGQDADETEENLQQLRRATHSQLIL